MLLSVFLSSCFKEDLSTEKGKKPIYVSTEDHNKISSSAAKSFTHVGKIFKLGNRIYISDKGTGVHIINNSNPSAPTKEAFIFINGNKDMAVKGNTMFADNSADLLAIDISNLTNVSITKRVQNVYGNIGLEFPLDYSGYFECVDAEKGFVVDWVDSDLENPECQR